jgi:uncharacterized protein (TIGR03435 family)
MLQNLLIERFQLKFHWQKVELPGFGLIVAKGGPKLEESMSNDTKISFWPGWQKRRGQRGRRQTRRRCRRSQSHARICPVALPLGRPRTRCGPHRTGGLYDFRLTWNEETGAGLETALREQLGLRMQSEKVQTAYFVIGSAQPPSEN